jgi:hypothetical protein
MLYGIVYAAARALLGLLVRGGHLSVADIELLLLRHEARVARRAGGCGAWRPADRLVLAALSRCLPPRDWHVFPVHPATLRRWHRELLQRKRCADSRRRGPGRPPLAPDLPALIERLARENARWGYRRIRVLFSIIVTRSGSSTSCPPFVPSSSTAAERDALGGARRGSPAAVTMWVNRRG